MSKKMNNRRWLYYLPALESHLYSEKCMALCCGATKTIPKLKLGRPYEDDIDADTEPGAGEVDEFTGER